MLCQFTFWNYKSYRDEVTLDFCPLNITEHEEHLIIEPITGEKFLPIAVLYGPNGGGKSTVLDSFRYLQSKILRRPRDDLGFMVAEGNDRITGKTVRSVQRNEQIQFIFDRKYSELPTGWIVNFITDGCEYKYSLEISMNQIINESLYAKCFETGETEMLFERNQNIIFGDTLKDVQTGTVNAMLPLISFISELYGYEHITNVMAWFRNASVIDYSSDSGESNLLIPEDSDVEEKTDFFNLLHSMGIQIDDLLLVEDANGRLNEIFTIYRFNGENYQISFKQESSGTKKIFSFLLRLMISLREGRPLFIDELDAKLHPKLLEFIISLFTNRSTNSKGAQLIITSHDLHTLDNKFLRRDEIWFAAKRDDFSTYLYSLSDFKKASSNGKRARKDENYAKQYIEGRYGADPYFNRIENWSVDQ